LEQLFILTNKFISGITMKICKYFIFSFLVTLFTFSNSYPQSREVTARGSSTYRTFGVHRGNQVRTIFGNYGVIGQPVLPGYPRCAWKYDPDGYVGDVSPLVGLRLPPIPVKDSTGKIVYVDTIVNVQITPVSRPGGGRSGGGSSFWGFDPIPGFFNPNINQTLGGVAMSNLPQTWPTQWPDQPDWSYSGKPVMVNGQYVTPAVDWNGYFGRAQFNADQESYFWMDDNEDLSMYSRWGFKPDSTDPNRRGEAIQVSVRGLQWSNFLAQNVIFWLYNIKNDGTSNYPQAVFGTLVGTYVGISGDEYNDDASFFDVRQNITYTWDIEPGKGYEYVRPEANPQWQPNPFAVGYVAYAFLESPGNQYDGIDNDGDNASFNGTAPYFSASDFNARVLHPGDKLVLIDPKTYKRTITIMPNDTTTVYSLGIPFKVWPGDTLQEGNLRPDGSVNPNAYDGIDNNLNGIIDENYLIDYRQFKKSPQGVVLIDTVNPIQHKDFINGIGLSDPMIDEARDDGIDNNKNWNPLTDDVGLDGKPNTGDFGEGDGKPTSGYQKPGVVPGLVVDSSKINMYGLQDTGEPGEPDIDKTDVQESDMIGLTSFQYFVPAGDITMSDEVDMWRRMHPGYFDVPASVVNNTATHGEDGDFIVGSGYFPMPAGHTERFSLALLYGDNLYAAIKTKKIAQTIYDANYNFPQPPDKPTLTAVPGDGQVTLYWDRVAEHTIDKTTKKIEFEGYKIYRGTDPDFSDALQISDGTGAKVFYQPIFQCDLVDGVTGYFNSSPELYQLTNGAPYYLGDDSGIQNFYVDKNLTNGRTYYYAVVAYTKGESSLDIFPTENTHYVSKDANGNITTDINTAAVIPNAPVLGYVPPKTGIQTSRISGYSTAIPYYEVMNPTLIKDSSYKVTFNDSLVSGVPVAYSYNIQNAGNNNYILKNAPLLPSNGVVANGFWLSIDTTYQDVNNIVIDSSKSGWNNHQSNNLVFSATQFSYTPKNLYGVRYPKDYAFVFSNTYNDTAYNLPVFKNSGINLPTKVTNFNIYDVTDRTHPIKVQYVITESGTKRLDTLSANDIVFISDSAGQAISWRMLFLGNDTSYVPKGGDTLMLSFTKPISSKDQFTFTTSAPSVDQTSIRTQLDKIKVVPNPYVVTDVYEQPLPSGISGRGQRVIYFTHLPANCTIHIYTSAGDEVQTLLQSGNINDGTVQWDLKSKEGLDVAYGVYFYVVEANTGDKKIGKFALIK
jgi:hypothetical protein